MVKSLLAGLFETALTYHSENDIRLRDEALERLLGDGASLFEGLAPRHCAVAVVKWCQTLGGEVLLKV